MTIEILMKPKDGYRSRLDRVYHNEEKRRQGKLPPLVHESGEARAAKVLQAFVDEHGNLPHPDVLRPFLDIMIKSRAERADFATTLRPDPCYDATRTLFADFNLDPADPENWGILLHALSVVLYGGPRKQVGRPKGPGADKRLRELMKAEIAAHPKASNRDITRAVAKKAPALVNKGRRGGVIGLERRVRRERKTV